MVDSLGPERKTPDPYEPSAPLPVMRSPAERVLREAVRQVRRLVILVVGLTVVLLGLIMVVAPGPAFIVIPTGLAVLALEFVWAQRLLARLRARAVRARDHYWRWYRRGTK